MKKKKLTIIGEKLIAIHDALLNIYGPQVCFLNHRNSFELLIAVILSAQCTDKTVNSATPALFEKFPNPHSMATASAEDVMHCIRRIGFCNAKTRYLIESSRMIIEKFGGVVPGKMEDLITLPGVGRKTANVVLADEFKVPGFPVDTHVKRLLNRMGIVKSDDPEKIEAMVNQHLPPEYWGEFSHLLIIHGRNCCSARSPKCPECPIRDACATGLKGLGVSQSEIAKKEKKAKAKPVSGKKDE